MTAKKKTPQNAPVQTEPVVQEPAPDTGVAEAAANVETNGVTQAGPEASKPVAGALQITARRDGFRRAGRSWSRAATTIAIADLTQAEIDALRTEPMLDVVEVTE